MNRIPSSLHALFPAALAVLVLAGAVAVLRAAPAAAQEEEQGPRSVVLFLEEGDRLRFEIQRARTLKAGGVKGSETLTWDVEMVVDAVDGEGAASLTAAYRAVGAQVALPGDDLNVNTGNRRSVQANADVIAAVPWLKAAGHTFQFRLLPDGTVEDVDGHDELTDAIAETQDELWEEERKKYGRRGGRRAGREELRIQVGLDHPFTDDGAAAWLTRLFGTNPDMAVQPGSAWRVPDTFAGPPTWGTDDRPLDVGSVEVEDEVAMVETGKHRGDATVECTLRTVAPGESAEGDEDEEERRPRRGGPVEASDLEGEGTLVLHAAKGVPLAWKQERSAEIPLTVGGNDRDAAITETWTVEGDVR